MNTQELILLKIEELENEYNSIDVSKDELELAQIQRNFDERNDALNVKRARRADIMKEITNYRDALVIIKQFGPIEEMEEKEVINDEIIE